MSTLAWDGKTLAVDRMKTDSGMKNVVTKIFRESGTLAYTILGSVDGGLEVLDWLRAGSPDKVPEVYRDVESSRECVVFRLRVEEGLLRLERLRSYGTAWDDCGTRYAAGSGRDWARGALEHGATAIEAVEIASRFDSYSGFGVDSIDLNGDGFLRWTQKGSL